MKHREVCHVERNNEVVESKHLPLTADPSTSLRMTKLHIKKQPSPVHFILQ